MPELFASCISVLFLDQWSKRMVNARVAHLPRARGSVPRLRRTTTRRSFYGRSGARVALVLLWVAAVVSAITLQAGGAGFQAQGAIVGVGAALGGAGGNLFDIIRSGQVTDFIDLGWWPVFNLADAAILAGIALAFWPR